MPSPSYERKQFDGSIATEPGQKWVLARISTTSVDRDGDVLLPSGADVSDFEKNPVVLLTHQQGQLPIGRALGIRKRTNDIVAKVIFADRPAGLPPQQEWVPDTVHELFKQGVLRAFSVGFTIPIGGARAAEKRDLARFGENVRRVITRWKLAELSVVPLPANQDALAMAVSKGLLRDSWLRAELGCADDLLDLVEPPAPILELDRPKPLDLAS